MGSDQVRRGKKGHHRAARDPATPGAERRRSLEIRKVTADASAEVLGSDPRDPPDTATVQALRATLDRHKMPVVRAIGSGNEGWQTFVNAIVQSYGSEALIADTATAYRALPTRVAGAGAGAGRIAAGRDARASLGSRY